MSTIQIRLRIAAACLAPLAFSGAACANDFVRLANYEVQSLLGVGGRAHGTSMDYTHNTGAYVCRSTGAGTTHVTFPFVVPDSQRLNWVVVTGQRTSAAPPLKLQVVKSCMKWHEVKPTTTILKESVPSPDAAGYFSAEMEVGDAIPNNFDCKYRVDALFDVSTVKCTSGESRIQKIAVFSTPADRIFRGSFHTNVTLGTP